MYAISRIDQIQSRTHAWVVRVQRRRLAHARQFSDGCYGGKTKALTAAQRYRDELLASLVPITRQEVCQIRKKNNRSGVSGVTRIDTWEWSRGRRFRRRYWDAQWPDRTGRAVHKKFSIRKYGERRAFRLAVLARRNGLCTLSTAPFRTMER
ncbi:MAG: hypothetical protein U0236_23490 [Nitrospira sp.]